MSLDLQALQAACASSGLADIIVSSVRSLSGGAASDTYYVAAIRDGHDLPLIVQRMASDTPMDGAMSKRAQARLQQKARAAGLPVAEVLLVFEPHHGLGDGYMMDFIAGETLPPKYLKAPDFESARAKLGAQTAQALAQLHKCPLTHFADVPLKSATPAEQVATLFDWYRQFKTDSPAFDLAFAWLHHHVPQPVVPCVVHGDFRSGNFIVQPEAGLVAVLDWELAHIGDPLEDLGWICVNSWRFGVWQKPVGGFALRDDFYAAYESAFGHTIDRASLYFWELFGTLRWGMSCLQLVHQHLSGAVVSVERAAIGRRVSEVELDILYMMKHGTI
jgi:aminoglycoside phosphotransferase (APT) family kinase protein